MERKPARSSNLRSVGYNEESQTLEIEFKNKRVYQYKGVPKAIYISLMNVTSHGKYFHKFVKDKFPTTMIK